MHLFASTTVTDLPGSILSFDSTSSTAFITSESFPTPLGSIITLCGSYFSSISLRLEVKSPTKEQQIQPEFISFISMPESSKNPPSIPTSPNSFSIKTVFSFFTISSTLFINVVFPAPKNPETISIFVIIISLLYCFFYSIYNHYRHYSHNKTARYSEYYKNRHI